MNKGAMFNTLSSSDPNLPDINRLVLFSIIQQFLFCIISIFANNAVFWCLVQPNLDRWNHISSQLLIFRFILLCRGVGTILFAPYLQWPLCLGMHTWKLIYWLPCIFWPGLEEYDIPIIRLLSIMAATTPVHNMHNALSDTHMISMCPSIHDVICID